MLYAALIFSPPSLDALDDFSGIPVTSPILGLEAGRSRRNLATARGARPPSLPKQQVASP